MSEPAAAAEKTTAHCFAKCRTRQTYTRQLGSRPVFACDGCGNTREIEELGRVAIPGQASPVPPPKPKPYEGPLKPFVVPKKRAYTNRRQETKTMKKSPLIAAIEKAVAEQIAPIIERLDKLEEKPDIVEVDEAAVKVMVEKVLEDQLGEAPTRRTAARAADGPKCPRSPHPGRHGKLCREAGYAG